MRECQAILGELPESNNSPSADNSCNHGRVFGCRSTLAHIRLCLNYSHSFSVPHSEANLPLPLSREPRGGKSEAAFVSPWMTWKGRKASPARWVQLRSNGVVDIMHVTWPPGKSDGHQTVALPHTAADHLQFPPAGRSSGMC